MDEEKEKQEDTTSGEGPEKQPEDGAEQVGENPDQDNGKSYSGSAGINAEESEALARGLEWLDSTRKEIPEIPDVEKIEKGGAGKNNSRQSEIDDLIASVISSSQEAPDGKSGAVMSGEARPTEFPSMEQEGILSSGGPESDSRMGILLDIPVRVTVVLGNSRKTIGEIISLEPGAIIELDRIVGEPVDVLANGKLIFRGEVVVIDENFGVRVVEMTKPASKRRGA
ncbi:MAG TPA: flagellar motor switch protein FliN [Synergistetes bacterium]|nr:flagellar motor switch protein FliN [Synergistota bacterium]